MSKKLLFYTAVFILLGLIILLLLFSSGKKPDLSKNITTSTAQNSENEERNAAANLIVKNFQLQKIGSSLPKSVAATDNSKISPAKRYQAYLKDDKLMVLDNTTEKKNTVNLSENLMGASFAFLNNKYLLLIEKDKSFHKLDLFYIVSLENFEKQFFAGSFPIASRLDLGSGPVVEDEGKKVYLRDKTGIYWLLKLTF